MTENRVQTRLILAFVLLLTACSSERGNQVPTASEKASDEPPFYKVYPNGTGPLTMGELQINIPADLDAMYTDQMRVCFLAKIEELAANAGDPETLDPTEVAFLPTDGTWEDLPRSSKRLILAQAVVSRAATLC
ncbi:MAG: hypothetical protein AAGJ29_13005 [Pseudomonadota bacterium]